MLYFITGNKLKISSARQYLSKYDIEFEVKDLPLIEIQSTSTEDIAMNKAQQAFAILKKPLIVKDDSWLIDALNGFPGPYMRYVNEWFSTEDFMNLLSPKQNKQVRFHQVVCYIDHQQTRLFTDTVVGRVLDKPSGSAVPFMELCTFRKDSISAAEANNKALPEFEETTIWNQLAEWLKENKKI